MENKIKIKVKIADRIYPLTIRAEQEEAIRLSVKKIDQIIKQLEENYAVRDKQDVLAMCSLQYATKLIQKDKFNDAKTTYPDYNRWDVTEIKEIAFLPKQRGLANLIYSNLKENWFFDATFNYIGKSRIPKHESINKEYSDPFSLINCQITHKINNFDLYVGGENLLEYKQENPILGFDDPQSDSFDASMIWAPVNGRRIYFGLRYRLTN